MSQQYDGLSNPKEVDVQTISKEGADFMMSSNIMGYLATVKT